MKKRLFSILLALIMVIGFIPDTAFAEDTGADSSASETCGTFTDGEQVIRDMIGRNGMYAHPRIIMSEEKFAKLKTQTGTDSVTAILLEKLRSEADRILKTSVCEYEISDGIRLLETSKRIQRRVAALALAYNIFGDEQYAQRCYAELEAACNFKDWNPSHFLDTAEMTTGFALGYDWLYHWMNEDQRAFIRTNLIEKGFNQVMDDYADRERTRTYRWYQDYPGDNWKLVCTGSMNLAALAVGDEADAKSIASEVLTCGYREAYSFVRRAYSEKDGTYSEGLGYWDYATYYLGLQSSALISAAGTDYGLADYDGLRKSVDFVRYMSSNTPKSFSFGDDRESRDTGWTVLLWLGDYFQEYDIAAVRIRKIPDDSFNYLDLLWIDEEKASGAEKDSPTDWGEAGASNASFRNTWDESGIVTALHAGENVYKYHGHYDLGSFYLESNGARFFTDLGNENYELSNRQYSYRIRAEGHNTLVINPSQELDQKEGAECLISKFSGGNEAFAVTDLTAAYEPSGAESVVRGLKMIKDQECVIIQDEISLNAPGEIYWFAHTKGQITVAEDGRSAVVTVGSDKMWVGLIGDDGKFTAMNAELLPTSRAVPNQTDNSEYRKLAVPLTDTKDAVISVACIPLKQGETQPARTPSVKAISEWEPQITRGDVNGDGVFDRSDAVLLQKWLLALPNTAPANWKAADFCADNRLNAVDLSLMKRALLEKPQIPVTVTVTKTGGFFAVHEEYQAFRDGEKYYISFQDRYSPFLTEITEEQYNAIVSFDYSGYLDREKPAQTVADDFNYYTVLTYADGTERSTEVTIPELNAMFREWAVYTNKSW